MPETDEAPLLAIALPRPTAAVAVERAWSAGRAVAVLDPDAPPGRNRALLRRFAPTHLLDETGESKRPAGRGVHPDVAAVIATSGTAAAPKAVELTWTGLERAAHAVADALGGDPDRDRWLMTLPLTAVGGLAILARSHVTGTPCSVDPGFDLESIATAPTRRGATLISLVATQLHRLLDAGAPLHEYRAVLLGGGPVPAELHARARAAGVRVHTTYGMTETWGGCVHDGRALAGVEIRLASTTNEIEIRGDCVMRGYRGDDGSTAAAFTSDGWLRSGDVGRWAGPDELVVVDRRRDIIISGGVNVSPTAVEAVLIRHPGIADVAVAGRPDPEWGERVVAFVVPEDGSASPTLDEVREFGRSHLRAAELPRAIVALERIPRTPGGKVRRGALPASM